MSGGSQAAVTPVGVRDGDPVALRGLVARRGSAVLAFCEAVCEPEVAPRAAAEAFARFRAAVAAADDPGALQPEALLLGATRHAAASMATTAVGRPGGGLRGLLRSGHDRREACTTVPLLLAARAADMLDPEDLDRLNDHLASCAECREVEAAFRRAERSYRSPPERTLDEATEHLVMSALAGAAPLVAPGSEAFRELVAEERAPAEDRDDEPLAVPEAFAEPEPEAFAEPEPDAFAEPEPLGDPEADAFAEPEPLEEPEPYDAAEPDPLDQPAPFADDAATTERPALQPDATLVFDAVALPDASAEPARPAPTGLPRTRRQLHLPHPHLPPSEPLYRYVLPGVAVAVAVVIILAIAGVFGGQGPAPSPVKPSLVHQRGAGADMLAP